MEEAIGAMEKTAFVRPVDVDYYTDANLAVTMLVAVQPSERKPSRQPSSPPTKKTDRAVSRNRRRLRPQRCQAVRRGMGGSTQPVVVQLRFSSQVAYRVRETVWHASQQIVDLPDGRLLWTARIAEPREMYPWIRGWGADVEVLEPPELRQRIGAEAQAMAAMYGAAGRL